jgi:hypothetical protein
MIERVTGYADTAPIDGEPPASEANQRITISLALVPSTRHAQPAGGPVPPRAAARVGSVPLPLNFAPPSS